jgi:uncharacterized protein (DUF1786 family)
MDVLLADTRLDMENSLKLILPSPTMQIQRRIQNATHEGVDVLLTGCLMGGGPSGWAAKAHIKAGNRVYALAEAAQSFDDDFAKLKAMGIEVVSEDEAAAQPDKVRRIELCDFNFASIASVFNQFGVELNDLAAVAVSVFDHGNAPAEVSDRKFRFDYLNQRIQVSNQLSTFAFRSDEVPGIMTRLRAVAASAGDVQAPLVAMDSAPAAVLGALYDPAVKTFEKKLLVNVGNMHCLAFRLERDEIEGVFEHHTMFLDRPKLEDLLNRFAKGSLTNEEVFAEHGHGALLRSPEPWSLEDGSAHLVVTGPRRSLLQDSSLNPYLAVPFGDMMTSGCVGLIAAVGEKLPELKEPISRLLSSSAERRLSPWEIE